MGHNVELLNVKLAVHIVTTGGTYSDHWQYTCSDHSLTNVPRVHHPAQPPTSPPVSSSHQYAVLQLTAVPAKERDFIFVSFYLLIFLEFQTEQYRAACVLLCGSSQQCRLLSESVLCSGRDSNSH